MNKLGTILPTRQSFEISKKHHETTVREKELAAIKHGLTALKQSIHGTEVRYWENPSIYHIIGRDMSVKSFEVRADGEYKI
jgi:hypothetical protein